MTRATLEDVDEPPLPPPCQGLLGRAYARARWRRGERPQPSRDRWCLGQVGISSRAAALYMYRVTRGSYRAPRAASLTDGSDGVGLDGSLRRGSFRRGDALAGQPPVCADHAPAHERLRRANRCVLPLCGPPGPRGTSAASSCQGWQQQQQRWWRHGQPRPSGQGLCDGSVHEAPAARALSGPVRSRAVPRRRRHCRPGHAQPL